MARLVLNLHGKTSDARMADLIEDYSKRLKSNLRIEYHSSKLSDLEYVSKLPTNTILLDEGGDLINSIEFSERFRKWQLSSEEINLAIGPANGFPKELTNQRISLSKMTLPHELATVVLVEQIYRASEILRGTPYHRT